MFHEKDPFLASDPLTNPPRGLQAHHTVTHPNQDRTHGGLHTTESGAKKALKRVKKLDLDLSDILDPINIFDLKGLWNRLKYNRHYTTTKLEEGEIFEPFGSGGTELIHGVNDGTHGSEVRYESLAHLVQEDSSK